MRVHICAVGRLRAGPELELIRDYLDRFSKTGRAFGLGPAQVIEVEDKKNAGSEAEADLLMRAIPKGSLICALDERGRVMGSPEFSRTLGRWRDDGQQNATFLIGGADGRSERLRQNAQMSLSFGKMVWPHMLARVMLAEQLYRAATIQANMPYHRA